MAQRVSVTLVDDIDGTDAAETVTFALDGTSYEIDLSESNADALREALAPYVGHARRASSGRKRSGGRSASSSSSSSSSGGRSRSSAADMRAWARENGYEVSDRGRVSEEIRAAYEAAS